MLPKPKNEQNKLALNQVPASLPLKRIEHIRKEIDLIDRELGCLLERRLELAQTLGNWKHEMGIPIKDEEREKRVLEGIKNSLPNSALLENVLSLYSAILSESCKVQKR